MRTFKNLLVTGGAGFIGSNFIRHVFEKTDFAGRIVNFDALTYAGNAESLADVAATFGDRYVFLHADIRDAAAVARVREAGADGFLVGTALMRAARPGKKLEELTTTRKGKRQ